MSILLKDPWDGKLKLYIKGADSYIKERLDLQQDQDATIKRADDFLARASVKGFRTLLMAMRIVD